MVDNYVEFSGVVEIPKWLTYRGRILYNYVMVHEGGQYDTFEYVYSGTVSGNGLFRGLMFKTDELVNGV